MHDLKRLRSVTMCGDASTHRNWMPRASSRISLLSAVSPEVLEGNNLGMDNDIINNGITRLSNYYL